MSFFSTANKWFIMGYILPLCFVFVLLFVSINELIFYLSVKFAGIYISSQLVVEWS